MNEILLETERLIVRAFQIEDGESYRRLKYPTDDKATQIEDAVAQADPTPFLSWSRLSHEWFPKMRQPPYGDRAVVLKQNMRMVGAIGYVPCLMPFDQISALSGGQSVSGYSTCEFGLFWMIDAAYQRRGYATEAARAMIDYAFTSLNLKRIIATTEFDNLASQAVMRKAGMTLLHNPLPDPKWMQVVGVRYNDRQLSQD